MIYEFECYECGYKFDFSLSMKVVGTKKEPVINCPECKAKAIRLVTGGVGFILKGIAATPAKASKMKRQKAKEREAREIRQYDKHYAGKNNSLVPNYGGEVMGNWGEVNKARRADNNFDPLYDHFEETEKIKGSITHKISGMVHGKSVKKKEKSKCKGKVK